MATPTICKIALVLEIAWGLLFGIMFRFYPEAWASVETFGEGPKGRHASEIMGSCLLALGAVSLMTLILGKDAKIALIANLIYHGNCSVMPLMDPSFPAVYEDFFGVTVNVKSLKHHLFTFVQAAALIWALTQQGTSERSKRE